MLHCGSASLQGSRNGADSFFGPRTCGFVRDNPRRLPTYGVFERPQPADGHVSFCNQGWATLRLSAAAVFAENAERRRFLFKLEPLSGNSSLAPVPNFRFGNSEILEYGTEPIVCRPLPLAR